MGAGHHGLLLHLHQTQGHHHLQCLQGRGTLSCTHTPTHTHSHTPTHTHTHTLSDSLRQVPSTQCVRLFHSLQEYDLNKDGLISYREFEMVRPCYLRVYVPSSSLHHHMYIQWQFQSYNHWFVYVIHASLSALPCPVPLCPRVPVSLCPCVPTWPGYGVTAEIF